MYRSPLGNDHENGNDHFGVCPNNLFYDLRIGYLCVCNCQIAYQPGSQALCRWGGEGSGGGVGVRDKLVNLTSSSPASLGALMNLLIISKFVCTQLPAFRSADCNLGRTFMTTEPALPASYQRGSLQYFARKLKCGICCERLGRGKDWRPASTFCHLLRKR